MTALRDRFAGPRARSGLFFAALFLAVFISRVPFLGAGYGVNVDAWRVARVARDMAITGQYSVSRFPGYPVQEIICSSLWRGGPYALNGLTALLSAVAIVAFIQIGRTLQLPCVWLAGAALSATPVFYVSSACAKDYIWGLAFMLLSLLSALRHRPLLAGLLLGLATGCRITSLAMALPIVLILFGQNSGRAFLFAGLRFIAATLLTAAAAFTPVWWRYGWTFFTFYEGHGRPDRLTMLTRGTVEVFGMLGLIGLGIVAASSFFAKAKPPDANRWIFPAFCAVLGIYIAAYLRLPDQAGYLLPTAPFVLLLAQRYAPASALQVFCAFLIVSPFVDISRNGFSRGAILADRDERLQTLARIRGFLDYSATLPGRNTFVTGSWEPLIAVLAPPTPSARNRYVGLLNAAELSAVLKTSDHVFYLPRIREFNYQVYGIDLANYGVLDLRKIFDRQQLPSARIE